MHIPVLLNEVIDNLQIKPNGYYIDGTFGRGGHSREILAKLNNHGNLLACDKDLQAIQTGLELQKNDQRFQIEHCDFAELFDKVKKYDLIGKIDGLLLDLGVSSPQLDNAERGFSFSHDGALDMRMDCSKGITAQEWINTAEQNDIANIIFKYGDEKYSRRIARAIVIKRQGNPIITTAQLAEIVKTAHPAWRKINIHPATKTFQAIRIFINQELEQLENFLQFVLEILAPQGRLAIISFHSLEDRIVKRFMRKEAQGDDFPIDIPVTVVQLNPNLKINGKAITPSSADIIQNPRARSAVLRIATKL
jgi:16S rRNA (cytosine1402-N4)-methyltransferase